MIDLHESDLGLPLLAFVFSFYIITVIWAEIRRYHPQVVTILNMRSTQVNTRMVKGRLYRSLVMAFTTIAGCFTLFPSVYKSFIPIKMLDTTWVNVTGVILLIISLIWIVAAQSDFDSDIFSNELISRKMNDEELTIHSKKISTGYLLMFAGITITLANLLSVILFLFACSVYMYKQDK